jgi:hypothetical protein
MDVHQFADLDPANVPDKYLLRETNVAANGERFGHPPPRKESKTVEAVLVAKGFRTKVYMGLSSA